MAHIRLRKDGRYEGIICFKGKYFSVYDRNLQKLKTKITKKHKELKLEYKNEKTLAKTKKDWISLNQWYKQWLENDKKPFVSANTLKSIINSFEKHILPYFKNIKIQELTKINIQKFLNQYEIGRKRELITTYLKACITQAYKERLIEYNPFENIKLPKKLKSDKQGFSVDEQKTILEYIKQNEPKWYDIIITYLCLGCRRSELQTITKENIKNNLVLIQGTKTNNAKRYVKITNEFQTILLKTINNAKNINPDWITKKFKKILKKLNINGSIHSLRHSFITNHYYLGTPAKQIQEWAGHASIQMTMDIYTNINPQLDPKNEKEKIKNLYNNLYYYTD